MIEFYGRYDLKSASKMQTKKLRKMVLIFLCVSIIVTLVLLGLYLKSIIPLMVFILPVAFCWFITLFWVVAPKVLYLIELKKLKKRPIAQITISDGYISDGYITKKFISEENAEDAVFISKSHLKDVFEVVDAGDSYYICIGGGILSVIICEKQYLTKGTLEDFKEKFGTKIKETKDKWQREDMRDFERH